MKPGIQPCSSLLKVLVFKVVFLSLSIQAGLVKWITVSRRGTPEDSDGFVLEGGRLNPRSAHVKEAIWTLSMWQYPVFEVIE